MEWKTKYTFLYSMEKDWCSFHWRFTRLRARMLSLICIAQGKSCVAVGLNLGGASMPLLEEAEFVFHPIQG
jgi:hypothetical protein